MSDFTSDDINPYNVVLNYTSPYGFTQVTFHDLDTRAKTVMQYAVIFGLRLGFATVLFPIIYIVTKNKKTVLFVINQLYIGTLFVHSIMYICTLFKTYWSLTYHFSGYEINDKSALDLTAATSIVYVILIGLSTLSMSYQVHIVFRGPSIYYRNIGWSVVALSGLLGLASTVLYLTYAIMANINLYNSNYVVPIWVVNASQICYACSSFVVSTILASKLFIAIRTRKFLGLKQFSIFHILFIMSFQTMIIPSVIIVASFKSMSSTQSSNQSLMAIVTALIGVSLPITTMWANSAINETSATSISNTHLQKYNTNTSYDASTQSSPTSYKSSGGISADCKDAESGYSRSITDPSTAVTDKNFWSEVQYLAHGLEPSDLDAEDYVRATVETSINSKHNQI
ncbi:hypothetical protein OGAPHI_001788 [Ogataea philodendri]|uniref:Pheromone alpha factor receptor n=1 Tax=Ogataea philodendri TaxID=1378263 RepID=A0A9P8PAR4_9ASCO|nr:uncharacterized protein OGAPHI_001788 [Ogataea philodendri]KAH3668034.1 hypothetical protein OGAPHI_001788 [Ogataea philodendri]